MARLSRAEIFDPSEIVADHTIAKTVRSCYLLGDDQLTGKNFDHRKQWFEGKLKNWPRISGAICLRLRVNRITCISSFDPGPMWLRLGMIPRSLGDGGLFALNAKSSKRSMLNLFGFQPNRPRWISIRFTMIQSCTDPFGAHPSRNKKRCNDKGFLAMADAEYLEILDWLVLCYN